MDKTLIAERFTKAIGTYSNEAGAQKKIARHMAHLLQQHMHNYTPDRIVEFGCGTGNYSRLLHEMFRPQHMLINDICSEVRYACKDLTDKGVVFENGDAEFLAFPHQSELITSCSALQWFENPECFFMRCHEFLAENGYLAFSTFGKDNMMEMKGTTGSALDYRSLAELEEALSPRFDIVHSEEQILTYHYSHPMDVLRHLKETGVTGISSFQWTKGKLIDFCEQYSFKYQSANGVSLTYHPIYIIAKKKNS